MTFDLPPKAKRPKSISVRVVVVSRGNGTVNGGEDH